MYITVESAKKHLNLDADFHDDDKLIEMYIQAAERVVSQHINRPLSKLCERNDGILPEQVQIGILMLVGSFYNSRESTSYASITANPVYNYILNSVKQYASPSYPRQHPKH